MNQVAAGIIIRDGLVLACQRRHNAQYPLKWEFPGGKLEGDESPKEALVRELREELGIHATVENEFFRQEWVYDDTTTNTQSKRAFNVFYFLIHNFTGEPVNHVFEEIRWVTPEELTAMDILEGNRSAVERLLHHAKEPHIPQRQSA